MLRQRINEIRKNDKGFTLIELLIVIIILGVLAGVVVLAVNGITNRGVQAACKADLKTVEIAVEADVAQNGKGKNTGTDTATRLDYLIAKGFLKDKPVNTDYAIAIAADGTVTASPACGTL